MHSFSRKHQLQSAVIFICLATLNKSWAVKTPLTQIPVTLFGQPCLLQGPVDKGTLTKIHSISPDQIYPELSLSSSSSVFKSALEKSSENAGLPTVLDSYREKLKKRFEAQAAFFEALEAFQKMKKPTSSVFTKLERRYIMEAYDRRPFGNLLKKLDKTPKKNPSHQEVLEQLFDLYNESIEPDPEADFHRAIKKLSIQYTCSFEEDVEEPAKE